MRSQDGGRAWEYLATISEADDEASLMQLSDGRLLAVMRHNFGPDQPGGCQRPAGVVGVGVGTEEVACAFRQAFSHDDVCPPTSQRRQHVPLGLTLRRLLGVGPGPDLDALLSHAQPRAGAAPLRDAGDTRAAQRRLPAHRRP